MMSDCWERGVPEKSDKIWNGGGGEVFWCQTIKKMKFFLNYREKMRWVTLNSFKKLNFEWNELWCLFMMCYYHGRHQSVLLACFWTVQRGGLTFFWHHTGGGSFNFWQCLTRERGVNFFLENKLTSYAHVP